MKRHHGCPPINRENKKIILLVVINGGFNLEWRSLQGDVGIVYWACKMVSSILYFTSGILYDFLGKLHFQLKVNILSITKTIVINQTEIRQKTSSVRQLRKGVKRLLSSQKTLENSRCIDKSNAFSLVNAIILKQF